MTATAQLGDLVAAVKRDGRPVVRMRCSDDGSGWVVECEVYPVGQLAIEPKIAGPYRFTTAADAKLFVDASMLALQVFGCEVV